MKMKAINQLNMFITVSQYGQDNSADFMGNAKAATYFGVLIEIIVNLRQYAAAQTSGAVGRTTAQKKVLRGTIRRQMKEIARSARALGIENVGLQRLFSIPDSNSDTKLIAAAREFATEAEKFKADFLSLGMADDFVENLTADFESFEQALNEKATVKGEGIAATALIDAEIDRGMKAVVILDAIVRNIYLDNPAKLAVWTSARHVVRVPRTIQTEPPTG